MAKAKAKAAVTRKPAKAPARAAAATKSAATRPAKTSAAKSKAPAKATTAKAASTRTAATKTAIAKTAVGKAAVVKAAVVKPEAGKAAVEKVAPVSKTDDIKVTPAPAATAAPRVTQQLTLPVVKAPEAAAPSKPQPIVRKHTDAPRADLPPPDGFTLLVDGHFKNSFDDLKGAKAAASELKGRFPMLRVEIYDAAKKARLPA